MISVAGNITPTDTENESEEDDDDIIGEEDDDDVEPDDLDSQLRLEMVPSQISRIESTDRSSLSFLGRAFRRIRHITNISNVKHVLSVALVNITGYTLQELFKHEQKKPLEVPTSFSVQHMKRSIKRFQRRAKPLVFFVSYMKALIDWQSQEITLMAFLVYMLSVYTGWFLQLVLLLCILKLYVNYITTYQYPLHFGLFPNLRNGPTSDELPFGDFGKKKKFGVLLQVAKKAQKLLANLVDNMEKLNNLFMWKVPQLTMFLIKILALLLILSVVLSGIQFMKIIGLFIGIKFFIFRRLYKLYPNFKCATDTASKVWEALPTDAEFYEKKTVRRRITRKLITENIRKLRRSLSKSAHSALRPGGKTSGSNVQVIVTQENAKDTLPTDMEISSTTAIEQEENGKEAVGPHSLEPKVIEAKHGNGSFSSFKSILSSSKQLKTSTGEPDEETPTTSGTSAAVVSTPSSGNKSSVESTSPSEKTSVESNSPSEEASEGSVSPSVKASVGSNSPSEKASSVFNSPSEKAAVVSNSPSKKAAVVSNSPSEKASSVSNLPSEKAAEVSKSPSEIPSSVSNSHSGKAAVVSVEPSDYASVVSTPSGSKASEPFHAKETMGSLQSTTTLFSNSIRSVGSEGFSYTQGSGALLESTGGHTSEGNDSGYFALPASCSATIVSGEGSTGRLSDMSRVSLPRLGVISEVFGECFNSLTGTFYTGPVTLIKSNKHNQQITLPNGEQPLKEVPHGWTCVLEESTRVVGTVFHPGTLYLSLSFLCFKPTDVTSSPLLNIDLCKIITVTKAKKPQWTPGINRSEHIHITVEGIEKPYVFGSVSAYDECYKAMLMHGKVHNYQWAAEFTEVLQVYPNNKEYQSR